LGRLSIYSESWSIGLPRSVTWCVIITGSVGGCFEPLSRLTPIDGRSAVCKWEAVRSIPQKIPTRLEDTMGKGNNSQKKETKKPKKKDAIKDAPKDSSKKK
jgi:hypothetical protein